MKTTFLLLSCMGILLAGTLRAEEQPMQSETQLQQESSQQPQQQPQMQTDVGKPAQSPSLDIQKIQQLTGTQGQFRDGVLTLRLSPQVPSLCVGGIKLPSPMGLSSRIYFKSVGNTTLVSGDLVLLQNQVNPVIDLALNHRLEVTALQSNYLWDTPRLMMMHINGTGDTDQLASAIGKIFDRIEPGGRHSLPAMKESGMGHFDKSSSMKHYSDGGSKSDISAQEESTWEENGATTGYPSEKSAWTDGGSTCSETTSNACSEKNGSTTGCPSARSSSCGSCGAGTGSSEKSACSERTNRACSDGGSTCSATNSNACSEESESSRGSARPAERNAACQVGESRGFWSSHSEMRDEGTLSPTDIDTAQANLDISRLQTILGASPIREQGALIFTFGQTTSMSGHSLDRSMGVGSWAAFAGTNTKAVVNGDLAVHENQLQNALKALRQADINILAIGSRLTSESPRILFVHYMGIGRSTDLASGIRNALSLSRPAGETPREETR